MLTYGNEREVQQGEEWNLDILISQSSIEYVPFLVSSQRVNPMWAITVASTKYEKNERYVATWWQDLAIGEGFDGHPLPRFYQTVPEDLGTLDPALPITKPVGDRPFEALYRYMLTNEAVDPELGHRPYHYVYFDENEEAHIDEYECRIRMQFRSAETSEWGSQNYMYQITLVDTEDMADYINLAYETHPELKWPTWITRDNEDWIAVRPEQDPDESSIDYNTRLEAAWREFRNDWIRENVEVLFTFIKDRLPDWFQPDIDMDAPVGRIDIPQVILAPTKLQVNNNLRKII